PVFSDAAWSVWEPLIEEVRPKGKTPPKNLRRTISAIFWRHQNRAKWRALSPEFSPWWTATQLVHSPLVEALSMAAPL
ncbi:transposase, partial [Acetobacter orientalis]